MYKPRPKPSETAADPPQQPHRTFDDWQADQQRDMRTPAQRGIEVGAPVMWRYRKGRVIVTERATVTAISGNTLTIRVKGAEEHTCDVPLQEIVSGDEDRTSLRGAHRRAGFGGGGKDQSG